MGLDRQTKRAVIAAANELSDLNDKDFADRYKELSNSGRFTVPQCFILFRLAETYVRVKRGELSRELGLRNQKDILALEVEEI